MSNYKLTFFTCPKRFSGHSALIQRNAIANWRALGNDIEIILMGNDEGVAEAATEFGCRHIPDIATNELGTPLISDIFRVAHEQSSGKTLCYVNSDILIPPSILSAVDSVSAKWLSFLIIGRRWDVDIFESIAFTGNWPAILENLRLKSGILAPSTGIDYFTFSRDVFVNVPPFAIGRFYFDTWLVQNAAASGVSIFDGTDYISVLHQNHDYKHIKAHALKFNNKQTDEYIVNRKIYTTYFRYYSSVKGTVISSNYIFSKDGKIAKKQFSIAISVFLIYNYIIISIKYVIQLFFGEKFLHFLGAARRKINKFISGALKSRRS
ncbi:MAG: hypothetical protein LBP22_11275 [Deltaproteobacteria bacterium]|nr:hypothetical protein [Deltaproteobacteria bacterium]